LLAEHLKQKRAGVKPDFSVGFRKKPARRRIRLDLLENACKIPQRMKSLKKPMVIGPFAVPGGAPHGPARTGEPAGRPEALRFGRILVPSDFSDSSRKALKYAARFAEQFGSRVTLIHVLEPVMSPDFATFPLALDETKIIETARNRLLHLARGLLHERHIEAAIVRSGSPFHEIAETARELKADLIIMATHGFSGIKRALLGSTAERVVRHAQCAVMTVR
jgi:universal stress protein A